MMESESLLKELLETFRLEAQEHVGALSALLVELEKEHEVGERRRLLETIFRRMHTLKGAAHAVNMAEVAQGCQEFENLLADLKRGEISLDLGLFDRLHAEIDALAARIFADEAEGAPAAAAKFPGDPDAPLHLPPPAALPRHEAAAVPAAAAPSIPATGSGNAAGAAAEREHERSTPRSDWGGESVRISARLLEALLLQAEELVSAKLAASALVEEVAAAAAELSGRAKNRMRAQDAAREAVRRKPADSEAARFGRIVEDGCRTERETEGRLRALEKRAERHLRALTGMIDPLLEDVKKLHLLPFSSLTEPFHKLVRDIGRELGKEAGLSCEGGELEIDRRILAELKEPLLHILRNVMDHGIEKGAERRLKGKPEKGRISIDIRLQDAHRAEVVVADDGRGIDPAEVKGAALRLELLTPEAAERIADPEALQLVFESGVSTSPIITSLSGRGVGLAIVRENLEKLGGHVTVASSPAEGTRFSLCLPLSFAMMRGLVVETAGRSCILPAANVELTARLPRDEIRRVENRDTVVLGGEVHSLVPLAQLLGLAGTDREAHDGVQPVVLLNAAGKRIAFAVDQVAGVQEILVKPLGNQLSRVKNVAGATVLGNGKVVPVVNIGDLFRSALLASASGLTSPPPARTKPRRLNVLVAEDSITSRTLLKNILESAGFLVKTAIDGTDALSLMKSERFDVVVSDVEMPRMDGFELTAAIRADSRWATVPVVLVTGLESRHDRERGIDVGASAYLVKSSFDQSGLIEIINRLA
jgi:two-component system, chemotaxis family, sensor kinase CheA